jgi:hypothetical protein
VPWKDYKHVAADLKRIYQSATEEVEIQRHAERVDFEGSRSRSAG